MADGQAVQDPRTALAARIAGLKTPAALPTAPGMGADAAGPIQTPQFAAPNAYAYPAGSAPMLPSGILPPSNPVQPVSDLDSALQSESLASSHFGRQEMAQELNRVRGMTDEENQLRQQQAGLVPELSYHPHFSPITGHGFVHGLESFLGDLRKGAIAVGASTGPGRAIENVVYSQPRQQYANLAQQIQDIRGQVEGEKETVPALASMAYHPLYSMARGLQAEVSGRHFTNQDAVALQRLDQDKWKFLQELPIKLKQLQVQGDRLGVEKLRTQAMVTVADLMSSARNYATQAGVDNNDMDNWVRQRIANLTQAAGMAKEHPYGTQLGITPEAPQVPLGPQPSRKAVNPNARHGKAGPGGKSGNPVSDLVKKYGG